MFTERSYDAKGSCDIEGVLFIPSTVPDIIENIFDEPPITPTRLFDDLYYVGTKFVGVLLLTTSDGIIMIDSMNHDGDADNIIIPGMKELGLNPHDIKYIIITHGHVDHYGAAKILKQRYGCKTALSKIDHQYMLDVIIPLGDDRIKQGKCADPGIDIYIGEGDSIVCGNKKVDISFTPGHTPGGVSLIFPVTDNGEEHMVGLWGGTKIPDNMTDAEAYLNSICHFINKCDKANVDVSVQIHPFVDYNLKKGIYGGVLENRNPGEKNPLILGKERYRIFQECIRAAAVGKVEKLKCNF